ncbi:MAG: hypothetical protein NWT04_09805 [Verrucomicrobiales bacterium]|nr:hypothetical protein [Verrucomicrobiales bacterium]
MSGHFEEAKTALLAGQAGYWSLPETYLKVPRRLVNRLAEKWSSSLKSGPKAILDSVFKPDVS